MLTRLELEQWLLGVGPGQRCTQDSPILPEVWHAYALSPEELGEEPLDGPELLRSEEDDQPSEGPGEELPPIRDVVDLLLRPLAESSASELARALARRLDRPHEDSQLVFNDAYVACRLSFREMLHATLPLTEYWQRLWPERKGPVGELIEERRKKIASFFQLGRARVQGKHARGDADIPGELVWLVGLVGRIAWEREWAPNTKEKTPTANELIDAAVKMFDGLKFDVATDDPLLWTVGRNRPVRTAVWRSRVTCKVDAATQLFALSCKGVRWAVIDSGVDARHPAFVSRNGDGPVVRPDDDPLRSGESRVAGTWDFVSIREVLMERQGPSLADEELLLDDPQAEEMQRTAARVASGQAVNWAAIAPSLEVPHDERYRPPADDHGTHVAGILAADWRPEDRPSPGKNASLSGMCPDIVIYDLRAFDEAGKSDEFQVLSAMQFVRHLNAHADMPLIHGVNLSFSIRHEVDKYAAGATPVCEEANRLVGSGVVAVAAAGNEGRGGYIVQDRVVEGYRSVSITDPGNAEKAITVGATHRERPHTYGVSYFSSRGPTGSGSPKPDLVAPGEKITSVVPNAGLRTKDGTSQATPHVSGACALLMARHPELIGRPERIKQILLASCTDLGRERSFQGAGMIDVLRAIQSV